MEMDQAPLNKAHQLERKAQLLEKQENLDQAIVCYSEALELYQKCFELTKNQIALDSINLQKEKAERQVRILQIKKSYLERTAKDRLLPRSTGTITSRCFQVDTIDNLQDRIFKNLESHDSLICYLADRGIINSSDRHCHSPIEEDEENGEAPLIVGSKHPKSDSVVIEELRELSGQLKDFVQDLLIALDDRNILIDDLKAQITDLELEKSCSQAADLRPEYAELQSFPKLESLVMPPLDVTTFKKFSIPEVSSRLLRKDD
ncbi:nuclear receptor-binding factor 2 isoform X4 [Dendroctonus ponderosae]|uniref:Nuclear receptor-binding factor 2 MIT domain-containing protein n=1 Tax=Dendroctonus ponderosae TaxID=77166 RepID=A0AAR5Q586_DENPD|nr:nuclear receptor-binding factor 2 isoform X4 [Dendroctonus ponderosae]